MGETSMCSEMFQENISWQNSFLGEKTQNFKSYNISFDTFLREICIFTIFKCKLTTINMLN